MFWGKTKPVRQFTYCCKINYNKCWHDVFGLVGYHKLHWEWDRSKNIYKHLCMIMCLCKVPLSSQVWVWCSFFNHIYTNTHTAITLFFENCFFFPALPPFLRSPSLFLAQYWCKVVDLTILVWCVCACVWEASSSCREQMAIGSLTDQ